MNLKDELQGQGLFKKRRSSGRVEFLALKDEIKEALDDGYLAIEVWEHLREKGVISIQYRMFVRYVNRFVRQKNSKTEPEPIPEKPTGPKQVHIDGPKRFEYDATPIPFDELV